MAAATGSSATMRPEMRVEPQPFLPVTEMWRRVKMAQEESDSLAFDELLLAGELVLKLTALGVISAVQDDTERSRYRMLYELVRADGVGDWATILDEALLGSPARLLLPNAHKEQRQLTERLGEGTWQHRAVTLMNRCVVRVHADADPVPRKVSAKRLLSEFTTLRNKTRGHGALLSGTKAELTQYLHEALTLFVAHFNLFKRQWAHLRQNISGKYSVSYLHSSAPTDAFHPLKTSAGSAGVSYVDGVYVDFGELRPVALLSADMNLSDVHVANGGFNGKRYELLSYITGSRIYADAGEYLTPVSDLPPSHTDGLGNLDVAPGGQAFTNLPSGQPGYVRRPGLEEDLARALRDSPASIVSLVGAGGIGKTSLALALLDELQRDSVFDAILWFSARDIDLLPEGPRTVRAGVQDLSDIAREYTRLVSPKDLDADRFDPTGFFREGLADTLLGGPVLFVFDNFETVRSPVDLFHWLFQHLRLPNKALITTRHRDFNGDYCITVGGMNFDEGQSLIKRTAERLHIPGLLSENHIRQIFKDSDGHPYVMKMLVGEVAKSGRPESAKGVFAASDEVLPALFERTYTRLSKTAKRCFLTLCDWRSAVPAIALEAVMIRSSADPLNVREAVSELHRSSFVELHRAESDETDFVKVPLVARRFGERKLAVSPLKASIEADRETLTAFGAVTDVDLRQGFEPRIDRFLASVARRSEPTGAGFEELDSVLDFIGRRYHAAWIKISEFYAERRDLASLLRGRTALERYLEAPASPELAREAWARLAQLSRELGDSDSEANALLEASRLPETPYSELAQRAYRLNSIISESGAGDTSAIRLMAQQLANLMESRMDEATPTDLSNLAWLWVHLGRPNRAGRVLSRALETEPDNHFCRRLATKLNLLSAEPST